MGTKACEFCSRIYRERVKAEYKVFQHKAFGKYCRYVHVCPDCYSADIGDDPNDWCDTCNPKSKLRENLEFFVGCVILILLWAFFF